MARASLAEGAAPSAVIPSRYCIILMPSVIRSSELLGSMLEIRSHPYVIPSVAEESKMPAVDSISGFLDSSATLGMT